MYILLSDYLGKVVMLGDFGVGKSSLRRVFCNEPFTQDYAYNIGLDFGVKRLELDGISLKFRLFDTYSMERFQSLSRSYYRGAHGMFLVYDVTNKDSFDNLANWLEKSEENAVDNVSRIIIGNKCDMTSSRQVDYATAKDFADQHEIPYIETSAKDGQNLDVAFVRLAVDIKRRIFDKQEMCSETELRLQAEQSARSSCCSYSIY